MNENIEDYAEKIMELYKSLWDDFHEIAGAQFRKYKFTAPQSMAIQQLQSSPYITLKELSEKLSLSKGTVSGIVDRLENQGLVIREIPKDNRRTVSLSLSPEFIEEIGFNYIKKDYLLNTIKDTNLKDMEKMIYGIEEFHRILATSINSHNSNEKKVQQVSRKIEFLDKSERRKSFPPEEILQMLPIKKTDNILDLGAGTGYLAIPAAKMVDGLVHALDMDPEMLEFINSKAQVENITNIQLVKGSIDNIPLGEDSIDIVLASLVLHEVKSLAKTLQEINRVLKDGGYFLCLEFEKIEGTIDGPPMHIRIPSSTMEQELINAGFSITQKLFLKDYLYIFIVKK